jgi:hypothetical protein
VLDRKDHEDSEIFSAFDELRDSPILPLHEKTLDRLSDEGTLMIMAGMLASHLKAVTPCLMTLT